jgi:hypothetical protein
MKTFQDLQEACEKLNIGAEEYCETSFIFFHPYTCDEYCVVYNKPKDSEGYYGLHTEANSHYQIASCKKAKTMFNLIKDLDKVWNE